MVRIPWPVSQGQNFAITLRVLPWSVLRKIDNAATAIKVKTMAAENEEQVSMDGIPGVSLDGIPGGGFDMPMATKKQIICGLPKLDELAREARACLFQDNFMGGKVDIQKTHSQNFATTHALMLSPPGKPSDYSFGCNFFDSQLLMMGQVKNNKDFSGTVRYEFTKRLSAMFRSQFENGDQEKRLNFPPFLFGSKQTLGTGGMDFMRLDFDYKGEYNVSNINVQRVHHCAIPDQRGALTPLMSLDDETQQLDDRSIKNYQCSASRTQQITESLCAGVMLQGSYQFQGPVALHDTERAMPDWTGSLGFRYDPKDWVLTGSLTRQGKQLEDPSQVTPINWGAPIKEMVPTIAQKVWNESAFNLSLEYAHKVVDKEMQGGNSIWFAAEYNLDCDPQNFSWQGGEAWAPNSSAGLGYMINLASMGQRQSVIKGKIDTDGTVTATVEETLNHAASIVISAALDHVKEEYRFGFGMQVGSA